MSSRDVVQTAFDEFGKESGGSRKSGSWYWRSSESVFVLNLQKSQYSPRYYINAAVWLLAAGPADAPKPSQCHIQTRLELLAPEDVEKQLASLLDMNAQVDEQARASGLSTVLRDCLLPVISATSTLASLRGGEGQRFVKASLVDGEGLRLLSPAP